VGLSVARQIAMISYRTHHAYDAKFGRNINAVTGEWEVANYLHYQGTKFLDRFDAVTYVKLTQQMDTHDVGRNREGGVEGALRSIKCPVLVMGIDSDLLYPLCEQQILINQIPRADFHIIRSPAGHDGFLIEQTQVSENIIKFLSKIR
jgi:homoserine O-acetyltransferase